MDGRLGFDKRIMNIQSNSTFAIIFQDLFTKALINKQVAEESLLVKMLF